MYPESYRRSGRAFVPDVAAGVCHRPLDHPLAETHPPNYSINVFLVDSPRAARSRGLRGEPWRLDFLAVSRSGPRRDRIADALPEFLFYLLFDFLAHTCEPYIFRPPPRDLSQHYTGSVTRRKAL